LPFLPAETLRVLRTIREKYAKAPGENTASWMFFNPLKNWYNPDVIGIDLGITLLMAENARTGFVWEAVHEERCREKRNGPRGIPQAIAVQFYLLTIIGLSR